MMAQAIAAQPCRSRALLTAAHCDFDQATFDFGGKSYKVDLIGTAITKRKRE